MLYLSNFRPQDERMTDYVAAQEAIKALKGEQPSSDSETILAACTGFSERSIFDALMLLGYTIKKRFTSEGAILLQTEDGSEALLGYRPPIGADFNKSILMLELSA